MTQYDAAQVVEKLKQIDLSQWKQTEIDGPGFPKYSIYRDNEHKTISGVGFSVRLDDDFCRSDNNDQYVLVVFEDGCTVDRRLHTFRGNEVRSLYEHLQQQRQDRRVNTKAVLEELVAALK